MTLPEDTSSPTKSNGEVKKLLNSGGFRPSDFMRARRPELFSDSTNSPGFFITREVFEYHLPKRACSASDVTSLGRRFFDHLLEHRST
jgi:hypothetical protein